MSASAGASGEMGPSSATGMQGDEAQQLAATMARFWWAWLVAGIVWIAASVVILQFDHKSITVVGIVVGIMFIVAGLQEFMAAFVTESGWRWLWAAFGVLLLGGGIWALFNPTQTFLAMADIIGFVFLLVGIGWTVQALATMSSSPLAWIGIVSGLIMIGLGFWAASQLLVAQVYTLLIFAGIWALLHGVTDIVKAFVIRQAGKAAFA
jgi:uncharacterized membrane protein HdeD (DUF308 family)